MHRFVDRLIGNGECVAGGLTYLAGLLDAKYLWFVKSRHKKPPVGGFATLLIALIVLFFPMVSGVGFAPTQHERRAVQDIFQEVNM